MNHNEEVPDFLGGLGDMLPANVLKVLNELLEQLHRTDKDHQGSKIEIVYVASGGQHVETQINIGASPQCNATLSKREPFLPCGRGVDSAEASKSLPDVLATDKAMVLWRKAQRAGYVDEHYQPLLSRTQAALLAHYMAKKLEIKDKWKTFELLWDRRNMYRDYYDAMNQDQTYLFLDKLKELFD